MPARGCDPCHPKDDGQGDRRPIGTAAASGRIANGARLRRRFPPGSPGRGVSSSVQPKLPICDWSQKVNPLLEVLVAQGNQQLPAHIEWEEGGRDSMAYFR
jgi:hypothetical protein